MAARESWRRLPLLTRAALMAIAGAVLFVVTGAATVYGPVPLLVGIVLMYVQAAALLVNAAIAVRELARQIRATRVR